jgi:hypothetical protein
MKHLIKHLSLLLMVLLAGMTVASCGDDEPNDSSAQSLLVGTWESTTQSDGYWDTDRMILNADGSGQGIEHYATSNPLINPDPYTFHWFYNESTKILTIIEDATYDDDSDTYYFYVSEINATSATTYEYENGKVDYSYRLVWTRVK